MVEPLARAYNLFMAILEVLPMPFQALYSLMLAVFCIATVINVCFRLR